MNRVVLDRDGEAAALAHRAQNEKIADRLRHADARSDGVRVLPARCVFGALLVGFHHRRAAGRLHRDHARAPCTDEADFFQFGERLPHADQSGAAASRIEDHIRYLPIELFGQLKSHGLLALDPVRLLQGGGIEPADFRFSFADDLAAVVDQAVDAVDRGALQRDFADIHLRRILRTEDRTLDAGMRGVSRERRAGIAVGRHRHVLDAERFGHRHRHHQAARLERAGRQAPFVLHQDFAAAELGRKLRHADQRRDRLAEADDVRGIAHRQQFAVAPQIGRAVAKRRFAQRLAHAGEIVAHQQRLVRARKIMDLVGVVALTGHCAFEVSDKARPVRGQIAVVLHHCLNSMCALLRRARAEYHEMGQ